MRKIAKSQMSFFVICPHAHPRNFRTMSGVPSEGLSGVSGSRNMQFPSFIHYGIILFALFNLISF